MLCSSCAKGFYTKKNRGRDKECLECKAGLTRSWQLAGYGAVVVGSALLFLLVARKSRKSRNGAHEQAERFEDLRLFQSKCNILGWLTTPRSRHCDSLDIIRMGPRLIPTNLPSTNDYDMI